MRCRLTNSMTTTTRRFIMNNYTHQTAPTQFVEANSIRFAYRRFGKTGGVRSEEHTSELQSRLHLVCRLLLEKKKLHPTHTLSSAKQVHPAPAIICRISLHSGAHPNAAPLHENCQLYVAPWYV